MKYIYAVLLLQSGGKEISEENIKKVIQATDSEADEAQIKSLNLSNMTPIEALVKLSELQNQLK